MHCGHVNDADMLVQKDATVNAAEFAVSERSKSCKNMDPNSTGLSNNPPASQNKRRRIHTTWPGAFSEIEKLDFMKHLLDRGLVILISKILKYVNPRDLCAIFQVSQLWKSLFLYDSRANLRRRILVQNLRNDLENQKRPWVWRRTHFENILPDAPHIRPSILRSNFLQEIISPTKVKYRRFTNAASNLKPGERLDHCLRCKFPARVERFKIVCTNKYCAFIYCAKCRCKIHKGRICPVNHKWRQI